MKCKFFLSAMTLISLTLMNACKEKESSSTTETKTVTTETTRSITPADTPSASTQTTTPVADPAAAPTVAPEFKIKQSPEDANGTPHADITLNCNGKPIALGKISGNAQVYEKSEYAEMGIPAQADAACGAWWAGAGDYFYVITKGGKSDIYQGWQAEEQEDRGYHWKKIKSCP